MAAERSRASVKPATLLKSVVKVESNSSWGGVACRYAAVAAGLGIRGVVEESICQRKTPPTVTTR